MDTFLRSKQIAIHNDFSSATSSCDELVRRVFVKMFKYLEYSDLYGMYAFPIWHFQYRFDLNVHLNVVRYYMTGTIFGCLTQHKAMKDCRWDYETYTCNYCTQKGTDLDLGYHVIRPQRQTDFMVWNSRFKHMDKGNRTYQDLQVWYMSV